MRAIRAIRAIDVHTHVWLDTAEEDRRELAEALSQVPLERVYVSGIKGELPEPGVVTAINDAVHILLKEEPRARGYAYLNPRHGDQALEELERCVGLGFVGVKLWVATLADDPLNYPIYELAVRHDLPVLLHCFEKADGRMQFESAPRHVAAAARRYPECTFIMAHVAGDFVSGTECVAGLANVYVDISGSYGEVGMVEYTVERLGADRILFGSDMPHSDCYHNLGKVTGAGLSDETKALILHGNAERILR